MEYKEKELKQGIKLHTIKTDKFKTNLMAIFLTTKLDRKNVKIFMCGNTVNKYNPYFQEMGLKNAIK